MTDDHATFLRKWAADIRNSSGQSVDADRLDEIAAALSALPAGVKPTKVIEPTYTAAEYDEAYELGKRDGYSDAVQQIDQLTGGDGEYRYCSDHDPECHTPGPAEMVQRIVDRFETLNLIDDAAKSGRDQDWGLSAIYPAGVETPAPTPDDWWAKELRGLWGDSNHAVTLDTRRAAKVALDFVFPTLPVNPTQEGKDNG